MLLVLLHALIPFYYVGQVLFYHKIPFKYLTDFMGAVFTPLQSMLFVIIIALAVVVAFGLYKVQAWAYWLFCGFTSITIIYNLLHALSYSQDDLIHPSVDIVNFGIIGLIIFLAQAKHVREPYFKKHLRRWERDSRYSLNRFSLEKVFVVFKDPDVEDPTDESGLIDGQISDMSLHGIFVLSNTEPVKDKIYDIVFVIMETELHCKAKVLRILPGDDNYKHGFAVLFETISNEAMDVISEFFKTLDE
jgi:hypothetical protein